MAQTLEQLKAENAEAEKESTELPTEAPEDELEVTEDEVETEETEEAAEPDEEETEETELEDWQQVDEQTSTDDGEARFTDGDVAAAKRKLRAKLEKKDDELEALKAQVEALKNGQATPAAVTADNSVAPKLEDFDYDESKYQAAVTQWAISLHKGAAKSVETEARQANAQRALAESVDSHYERAAKLAKESGIDDTVYQKADLTVRQIVESAFPQKGDAITDNLIARLGEGSEKVMYYLGRNAKEQELFKAKLVSDPSGLSASVYLGSLQGRIATPQKKVTQARQPAKRAEGGNSGSNTAEKMARKYRSETDIQKRFDMKRAAKRDGVDVSKW